MKQWDKNKVKHNEKNEEGNGGTAVFDSWMLTSARTVFFFKWRIKWEEMKRIADKNRCLISDSATTPAGIQAKSSPVGRQSSTGRCWSWWERWWPRVGCSAHCGPCSGPGGALKSPASGWRPARGGWCLVMTLETIHCWGQRLGDRGEGIKIKSLHNETK